MEAARLNIVYISVVLLLNVSLLYCRIGYNTVMGFVMDYVLLLILIINALLERAVSSDGDAL